jgi:hypothetical protein
MSCEITSGIPLGCRDGFGGIDEVLIGNIEDVATYTVTNGEVTAFTLAPGKVAYKYELEEGTSFYNENGAGSRENGTYVVTQQLNMVINSFGKDIRNTINTLTKGRFFAVVKYSDGKNVVTGMPKGHLVDSTEHSSGTAKADRNGVTVVSSVMRPEHAPVVSNSIYASLQVMTS